VAQSTCRNSDSHDATRKVPTSQRHLPPLCCASCIQSERPTVLQNRLSSCLREAEQCIILLFVGISIYATHLHRYPHSHHTPPPWLPTISRSSPSRQRIKSGVLCIYRLIIRQKQENCPPCFGINHPKSEAQTFRFVVKRWRIASWL
jgi:hypothetical protein